LLNHIIYLVTPETLNLIRRPWFTITINQVISALVPLSNIAIWIISLPTKVFVSTLVTIIFPSRRKDNYIVNIWTICIYLFFKLVPTNPSSLLTYNLFLKTTLVAWYHQNTKFCLALAPLPYFSFSLENKQLQNQFKSCFTCSIFPSKAFNFILCLIAIEFRYTHDSDI
jgi:hypothetical protein